MPVPALPERLKRNDAPVLYPASDDVGKMTASFLIFSFSR
jgi:hypothetical protein